MTSSARGSLQRLLRNGVLMSFVSILVCTSLTYGQSGGVTGSRAVPCMVNYIRLRIATADDDLRGGNNNLNVTIRFGEHGFQGAANVNNGAQWDNHTVHLVEIKFNEAVPLNEIKSITLDHLANGGLTISPETVLSPIGVLAGLKTPDKWNMQSLEVTAVGNGVGAVIASHGPKSFAGNDQVLNIRASIPANNCELISRLGSLNPRPTNLRPATGTGSKYGTQTLAPTVPLPAPKGGSQHWQNNRMIQQALAHLVQIGPRAGAAGLSGDNSDSALIALLRKQSAAARALLVPPVRPAGANQAGPMLSGGSAQMLNPQPLPPKGSTPQIGAGQTMSASGGQTFASGSSAMASNAQSGPTRPRAPSSPKPQMIGTRAPMPTQACVAGIGGVDGQKSGVWFSPVSGAEGQFVIQGCGFGNGGGVVYLSGLHTASQVPTATQAFSVNTVPISGNQTPPPPEVSEAAGGLLGSVLQQKLLGPPRRDRIVFQISAWSDRQIVAQIDPNASGLYDTNNVTLVVKTVGGQQYQASGFNFSAAREDQVLKFLPKPSGCTPQSTGPACVPVGVILSAASTNNGPIRPDVESPSVSLLQPGESIAVSREAGVGQFPIPASPGFSFAGGTDTYQFHFAPGFQLDPHTGVQLRHASMDTSYCQSVNGVPAKNGNWNVNYTSTTSFQVLWQEEACWPKSVLSSGKPLATLDYASLSAYELQITVLGPRGVSPWASGNQSTVPNFKQVQPAQLLHGY